MSTTTYYRARCGSLYRVTHTPARAAGQRKDRRDWKASPEAQRAIDQRHAQQNRDIMDRCST